MMQLAKSKRKPTSASELERKLLKGEELSKVKHIDSDSLDSIALLLKSNVSGVEFQAPEQTSSKPGQPTERHYLNKERESKERALNRLKTLYLYGDSNMSEREYVTSRRTIVDRIEEIDARLKELDELEHNPQTIDDTEFIERASYFLIAQNLLTRRQPFIDLICNLDEKSLKTFFNNIISEIRIKDGQVISITFKNQSVHTFIYD